MRGNIIGWKCTTNQWISIHASTWEATSAPVSGKHIANKFQFTPLHERQLMKLLSYTISVSISIHASTWEATLPIKTSSCVPLNFNSRLYMRGNKPPAAITCTIAWKYFNSRLYMRGNGVGAAHDTGERNFNSRLYMRGNSKNAQFFQ